MAEQLVGKGTASDDQIRELKDNIEAAKRGGEEGLAASRWLLDRLKEGEGGRGILGTLNGIGIVYEAISRALQRVSAGGQPSDETETESESEPAASFVGN
jgi:hypothetical protein